MPNVILLQIFSKICFREIFMTKFGRQFLVATGMNELSE